MVPRFLISIDVMRNRVNILIVAVILLILGGAIYVFFRDEVIFTSWIHSCTNLPHYGKLINCDTFLGRIFLYSLADALWYAALLLVDYLLRSDTVYSRATTLLTMSLPFILEFLQLCHIIPGTFDWIDIFIYLLTLIIFLLCSRNFYCKH